MHASYNFEEYCDFKVCISFTVVDHLLEIKDSIAYNINQEQ